MQKVSEDLQKETKLLFRCDVGKKNEIGTGHLIRSLTLAEQLSKNPKIRCFQNSRFLLKNVEICSIGCSRMRAVSMLFLGSIPSNTIFILT